MDLIIIIGAAHAFILSLFAVWKKNRHTGDLVLSVWLAFVGLHLLHHYLLTTGFLHKHPHLLATGISFPMLEGPLMYWYVLVMVNETGKFKTKYLLHTIPFIGFTAYLFYDFYLLSTAEKLIYYNEKIVGRSVFINLLTVVNVSFGPVYLILSILLLNNFRKNLADKFSYTEKISLDWLKTILYGLSFVWITVIIANLSGRFPLLQKENMTDDIVFTAVAISIFFIGIYGIKQQSIFISIPGSKFKNDTIKSVSTLKSGKASGPDKIDKQESEDLSKLVSYMEDEKPYLDPELNIGDLANSLQMHSHQLSKLINNHMNKNFYEFVNDYRVTEFKRNATDPKNRHITVLGLAMDAGFNSKASFNRIFKNSTGQTPSHFRENFKF